MSYEYNGYRYERYEEWEPDFDNVKIYHLVHTPLGGQISLDWSPYSELTEAQFRQFIHLGFPDRFALRNYGSPLDQDELDELSRRQFARITEEVRQNLLKGAGYEPNKL